VNNSDCSAGGCTPILSHIDSGTAIVLVVLLLALIALFWWGARRRPRGRRSRYEFDKNGRAHRVPADEDADE
jgi:hypothetical protein